MAQLRDTLIQGSARVTDTLYSNNININDIITAKGLIISDESANAHIKFSRESINYIIFPENSGSVAIGYGVGTAYAPLIITKASVYPGGTTETINLGASGQRWNTIYGKTGNFSGAISSSSTIAAVSSITAGSVAAGAEIDVKAVSNAGQIYLYSTGTDDGNRGIWLHNHGGTKSSSLFIVDQNNAIIAMAPLVGNYILDVRGYSYWGSASRYIKDEILLNNARQRVGETWYDVGDATNVTMGRFYWREYSPNSTATTGTTGKYEDYYLPAVNVGRTNSPSYAIITTKNLSDITSLGTISSDLNLKTGTDDSPDIVWWYNNNKEQARIWMGSGATTKFAPYYRCYDSNGNSLYSGKLVLGDGTGASGTWAIGISGNAATATKATQDGSGNTITNKYFQIYNTSYQGNTSTVTVNDLATQGPAYGMINHATDNPIGSATWVHVLNMGWSKANTSWIGQIALHTNGTTMYFRGNSSSAIAGKAWNTVLSSNNYSSYTLPLSGGTMSGTITLANTGLKTPNVAGYTTDQYGNFKHQRATNTDTWCIISNAGTNKATINYETGAATFAGSVTATGGFSGNASTATKATQDENGYNLNNTYAKEYIQVIDLTADDITKWYPVTIQLPYDGLRRVACVVQLNSGHKPSWSSHNGGYTAVVEMLVVAGGWGTTGAYSICLVNNQAFVNTDEPAPVGFSQFTNSSRATFWCRGGAKYRLLSDFFGTWTTYKTDTTVSSQTIGPKTSNPGISVNRSSIIANLSGNATSATNATNVTGTVTATHGGTGITTYTLGDIIYCSGVAGTTPTLSKLAIGSKGKFLKVGAGNVPVWGDGSSVTLNGTATTTPSFYAPTVAGTSGYYLMSNGSGAPSWATIPEYCLVENAISSSDWRSLLLGASALSSATTTVETEAVDTDSAVYMATGLAANPGTGHLYATAVHNAIWNDYAEYRKQLYPIQPGYIIRDTDSGYVIKANERLIPGAQVVSDTWGHIMGETDEAKTPVAVAGRVLAYTYRPREQYHAGMAVCSAPGGTIDIMTREEIRNYPDAIIGIVSEIPDYEEWGSGKVKVDGRIWIKVR